METERNYSHQSGITVKDLIAELQKADPEAWVCFGPHGHFTFADFATFDNVAHVEFDETEGDDYDLTDDHHYRKYLRSANVTR